MPDLKTLPERQERISARLRSKNTRVCVFESLPSTNDEAKKRILAGLDGTELIIALQQTNGRGRVGRSFYSPAETGLYMSLALGGVSAFETAVCTTTAAAVAVVRAIESLTHLCPLIKWVNDVYIDGKKLCGILTEAVTHPETGAMLGVVIGIGINLTTEVFPPELRTVAVSLGNCAPDSCELAAAVTNELLDIISNFPDRSFLDEYRRKSLVLGRSISYSSGGVSTNAHAVNIDDFGGLIIRHSDGTTVTLSSGEISLRLN